MQVADSSYHRVLHLSGPALGHSELPPLEPVALDGDDSVNALFEYRLIVQTPELGIGTTPWQVDANWILDRELTIHLQLDGQGTYTAGGRGASSQARQGAGERQISGVVAEVRHLDADVRRLKLELVVRPGLWEATLGTRHHAFHDMSPIDVLDAVLDHYPWVVDKRLIESYLPLEQVTQWGESDWRFCCRVMQQAGINHHFEHTEGTHRLVLWDHNAAIRPFGDEDGPYQRIPVHPPGHRIDHEYIHAFAPHRRVTSRSFEARDQDYTRPRLELVARAGEAPVEQTHPRREVYQWRAAGDAVTGGVGALWSQPNAGRDGQANAHSAALGRWLARIRREALVQHAERAKGEGHLRGIVPGCSFHLEGHTQAEANAEHLILSTRLHVSAPGQESLPAGEIGGLGSWRVHVGFATQPTRIPLRPDLTLAKPVVAGPEPGLVVGPEDGQVHTDALGRIKVWQPWQRREPHVPTASIWMRVAHPWAGNQQGAAFLPRVGQEVTVDYYGGDPDLPVVSASLHNAMNQPAWELPGQHALSGLRSRELGDGGGNAAAGRSNQVALDDTPGHIQVQVKSDHQHSSLSLGDIHRIEDWTGRRDARGQGLEGRTDGHGVLRAGLGLLLTTQARRAAVGGMKDLVEAARRLARGLTGHDQLARAAQHHNAQDSEDQAAVTQSLQAQGREIQGTEPLGELTAPHLLMDSAAGVQTTAAGSTQQVSGEHHAIVSGRHISLAAAGSVLASAMRAVRIFARMAGIRIFAAEQDIEVQAQNGNIDIRAKDTVRIKARRIEIEAEEWVQLNGDGSYSHWEGTGITHGTAGRWAVHAKSGRHTVQASRPVAPMTFPQSLCADCVLRAMQGGSPVGAVQP